MGKERGKCADSRLFEWDQIFSRNHHKSGITCCICGQQGTVKGCSACFGRVCADCDCQQPHDCSLCGDCCDYFADRRPVHNTARDELDSSSTSGGVVQRRLALVEEVTQLRPPVHVWLSWWSRRKATDGLVYLLIMIGVTNIRLGLKASPS